MHWSGDRTIWNRKANKVELFGHATVNQPGETLIADYITLDLNTHMVDAKGNCVYTAAEAVMYGDEMHFSMDSRTGYIIGGRVSTDRFTLTGERITRLGPSRFQTRQGDYSTCRDCPQSWTLRGDNVDMEFEGYAYLSNVSARIKDVPLFWMPYLIMPLKTRRQTGLLFPRFGLTNNDLTFVQPLFWAINRSADMTVGAGTLGGHGLRFEWEGRYALTDGRATVNYYFLRDKSYEDYLSGINSSLPESEKLSLNRNRWALALEQAQSMPYGIDEKLRLTEVSDNLYPNQLTDVTSVSGADLSSDLIFSHSTNQVSSYVSARRFRNLLNLSLDPRNFDSATVQVLPTAAMTTKDKFLFQSPFAGRLSLGVTNFTRPGGLFDHNPFENEPAGPYGFRPGIDPIRKAVRASVTPTVYTTLRPWNVVSFVPSLEYRSFFYDFPGSTPSIPSLSRGYLLFRNDLSTQLERIYETDDEDIPRIKHLFRPLLTYWYIPNRFIHESDPEHPFLRQIALGRQKNYPNFYFDSYDVIPLDTSANDANYFIPIGNSLSYGFTTQLIRRRGATSVEIPTYQRSVELQAGQTYNFRELGKANPQPFSRFFASLGLAFDNIQASSEYRYYPYAIITDRLGRNDITNTLTYILERSTHQQLFAFDRSISLSYSRNTFSVPSSNLGTSLSYSVSDYVLPSGFLDYDFLISKITSVGARVKFQSPSRCWTIDLSVLSRRRVPEGYDTNWSPEFALNLTGSGFSGVADMASSLVSH